MRYHLSIVSLKAYAIGVLFRKFSPVPKYLRLFPIFSSFTFRVSGFRWRSLIHLDFSFVQRDRHGSICILLHSDFQLNQHHLLDMLDGFGIFVKDQMTMGLWVYFWVFNSISMIYLSVSVPIPCGFISIAL